MEQKKVYPLRWVRPDRPISPKEGRDPAIMNLHDQILVGKNTWGNHGNIIGFACSLRGDVSLLKGKVEYGLFGWTGAGDKILKGDVSGLTGSITLHIDPESDDCRLDFAEHLSGSGAWLDDDDDE